MAVSVSVFVEVLGRRVAVLDGVVDVVLSDHLADGNRGPGQRVDDVRSFDAQFGAHQSAIGRHPIE